MKRHKNPEKAPPTDEQQVFVLPPDLLQKLGIQLSNLNAPTGFHLESSTVTQVSDNKVKNTSIDACDSSILETASLMKQSVLMSPTFVAASNTEITSESDDTLNIATGSLHQIQEDEKFEIGNFKNIDNIGKIEYYSNSVSTEKMKTEDIEVVQSTKEHEVVNNHIILMPRSVNSTSYKDNKNSSDVNSPVNHTIELLKYKTHSQVLNNNSEAYLQPQKSKIKILSEQIINDSDFNSIKKSHIQEKSSCFHIPVNTILSGKITKDKCSLEQKPAQDVCAIVKDKLSTCNEGNSIKQYPELVQNNKTMIKGLLSDAQLESITSGKVEEPNHKAITDMGEDNNEWTQNADYNVDPHHKAITEQGEDNIESFQNPDYNVNDNRVKNLKIIGCNEKIEGQKIEDSTTKEIVSNNEEYCSKSKLSIQGVEKPGGTREPLTNNILKTYQRISTRKTKSQLPPVDYTNLPDTNMLPDAGVIDLDKINIGGYKYINKFCNCYDYGQLATYDDNSDVYEHIHFCNRINLGCNLETLLTIYDDNYVLRDHNASEDSNETNNIELIQYNICWLLLNDEIHETAEEAVSEKNISDDANRSPNHPRRSDRKRRSITSGQTIPNEEHSFDKTIKCGVCDLMLPQSEWDRHKDSMHNFIAWIDGQTIINSTIDAETSTEDGLKVNRDTSQNPSTDIQQTSKEISKSKQINSIHNSPKNREHEHTDKSKSKSIWAPKDTQAKSSLNADNKETPKSTTNKIDTSVKAIKMDETTKPSSEIKEVFIKTPMKDTSVADIQETRKSKRRSMDVSLNATEVQNSLNSTSSEVSPASDKSKVETKKNQKSSIKSLDVAPIQNSKIKILDLEMKDNEKKRSSKSKNKPIYVTAETSENKCNKVDKKTPKSQGTWIEDSSKALKIEGQAEISSRKSVDVSPKDTTKSSNKSIPKATNFETTKSEQLPKDLLEKPKSLPKKIIEINIFPDATVTKKDVNAINKSVSLKKSKDISKVKMEPKSSISSLNPRQSIELETSNKLKRKRVEVEENEVSIKNRKPNKTTETTTAVTATTSLESPRLNKKSSEMDTAINKSISKKLSNDGHDLIKTPQELIEIHIPPTEQTTAIIDDNITDTTIDPTHVANEPFLAIMIKTEPFNKCGVCDQPVEDSRWFEHIGKEHNYLAWRENEVPLDFNSLGNVRTHLTTILKQIGALTCYKCDVVRKYVKPYLAHIKKCNTSDRDEQVLMDASTASTDVDTSQDLNVTGDSTARHRSRPQRAAARKSRTNVSTSSVDNDDEDVPLRSHSKVVQPLGPAVCGVCNETVPGQQWIEHIRTQHNYLAWKSGENPVNLDDEVEVKIFLQTISKHYGGLKCSKCGAVWSYVKKWLDHQATCKGDELQDESSDSDNEFNPAKPKQAIGHFELEILPDIVKCAKCSKEIPSKGWIDHIETEHSYLSWIEGHTPLDESSTEAVTAYLHMMSQKRGSLYCAKCGVSRKYPKVFLTHITACEATGFKREEYFVEITADIQPGEYECAVCHQVGDRKDFTKHAMEKHYNIAWMAGEMPINLKNPYAVEKYLKEYRAKHSLICKVCNASRSSCYGFYAHIMTCGKSEEELENLMNTCDVCNNKYLCIYRNQHMAWHKDQAVKREKKEQDAIKEEERRLSKVKRDGEPAGKRRAAQKAQKVMEKYTSNSQNINNVCPSCHIEFDYPDQLKDHACLVPRDNKGSDSDVSVKMEAESDDDDDDDDEDDIDTGSDISDEDDQSKKRIYQQDITTVPKMTLPFKVKDFNLYLSKSYANFCALHFTSECMFNNWRISNYNRLSEEEAQAYLPLLTESCHLRVHQSDWESLKRFEVRKEKEVTILFTGAAIRCMRWVPHNIADEQQDHYLAVSSFRGADCPRVAKDHTVHHPGMLQIWNIARFQIYPKLVMGIAHDYGTIWAMDWCRSGARDKDPGEDETASLRLGLVAIACSNGGAYILSVPLIRTLGPDDEPIICNLKPVAELRLSMQSEPKYQATSISWSPQKEHEVVMVGYSDGTTALYNLSSASPFLKSIENGVHIFYPFHDAHTENSPITGVDISASEDLTRIVGGVASSSVTGATMSGWPDARPAVRSHLAASSVLFTPNWPAAVLCSDDVLTIKSTNEMEWWGGGRRLGGACAGAACARCGRVCLAAPPFVRLLRAHPCYPELKKQIVATVKMVPLAQKRKLCTKDDLAMVIEPLTYDETVKKYGLEFRTMPKKDQSVASKLSDNAEQCPDRFPLSDMPAVAFCPAGHHHNRLAVASHAGFVFLMPT